MTQIRVIWPGKTRKTYYRLAIEDYASRIRKLIPFEVIETRESTTRDQKHRIKRESKELLQKKRAPVIVTLDSRGVTMSSEEFAAWLRMTPGDVDFFVGGPDGFDISGETLRWSLGKMTLPHELARIVVLEQIYRALTILKRIPYHK